MSDNRLAKHDLVIGRLRHKSRQQENQNGRTGDTGLPMIDVELHAVSFPAVSRRCHEATDE